ncbi:MAG: type II secretion system protein GspJ [Gammaproteobacteria bacterium RIFCSPHIGHO2_12_FULL_41_15]|nr:MAG: type II secretion system protein GspJ [Gammaproteobacteria bacterium RIFCSPHIGHO2_12_FULL_41_15]
MKKTNQPQSGFTLIEILIALAIFAIIGIICATAIRHMVDMHDRISKVNQRLAEVQIALVLMQRDMQEMIDRPVLDANAHSIASILLGGNSLTFTNSSNIDLTELSSHSNLQRISYQLAGSQLVRQVWPVLDQPDTPSPPIQQPLLTGITQLNFQLVDNKGRPQSVWPPPDTPATEGTPMPRAVIMTLTLTDWGSIQKVIATPGGKFHVV